MAQFDVCQNRGRNPGAYPYFVVVQSNEFERMTRRLVVPLTADVAGYPPMAPVFSILGRRVVADALLLFSIGSDGLGPVVASLADDASATSIINAIDRVISRARG